VSDKRALRTIFLTTLLQKDEFLRHIALMDETGKVYILIGDDHLEQEV
jgi:hypothetical protein